MRERKERRTILVIEKKRNKIQLELLKNIIHLIYYYFSLLFFLSLYDKKLLLIRKEFGNLVNNIKVYRHIIIYRL